ncbi:MAG: hypothetical protein V7754_22680, partial [Halioglobus sp.]
MTRLTSTYILALTLLISIVVPTKALAHEFGKQYTHILGGDTCHVRNSTNKHAASLRKVDGTIENISDDLTATISCPIPITYSTYNEHGQGTELAVNFGEIEIFFLNSLPSEERRFRCNVFAAYPDDVIDRVWSSVNILSNATGSIEFYNYHALVADPGFVPRRPTITCGL